MSSGSLLNEGLVRIQSSVCTCFVGLNLPRSCVMVTLERLFSVMNQYLIAATNKYTSLLSLRQEQGIQKGICLHVCLMLLPIQSLGCSVKVVKNLKGGGGTSDSECFP